MTVTSRFALGQLLQHRKTFKLFGAPATCLFGMTACVASSDSDASDPTTTESSDSASTEAGVPMMPSCPNGLEYLEPGCGEEPNLLQAGCFERCESATDERCTAGTVCREADINPCICPREDDCCAACGQRVWLCQEALPTECDDQSRDPILLGAATIFGECSGACRYELKLSAGAECDEAELVISGHTDDTTARTHRGILRPLGHGLVRTRAAELGDAELEDTYGCPDCADGGESRLTVLRNGVTTTTRYEFQNPPALLAPLDEVARGLINALQTCESNNLLEVTDCPAEEAE